MSEAGTVRAVETQRALRNVGALTLATLVSKGLLFLWQLVLARFLGESGYGIYGTVGAFIAIGAALTNFGTGAIVVREVARRPRLAGEFLGVTLWLRSGLALLAWLLLNAVAPLAGYEAELRNLLALASLSLLVDTWGNLCHESVAGAGTYAQHLAGGGATHAAAAGARRAGPGERRRPARPVPRDHRGRPGAGCPVVGAAAYAARAAAAQPAGRQPAARGSPAFCRWPGYTRTS